MWSSWRGTSDASQRGCWGFVLEKWTLGQRLPNTFSSQPAPCASKVDGCHTATQETWLHTAHIIFHICWSVGAPAVGRGGGAMHPTRVEGAWYHHGLQPQARLPNQPCRRQHLRRQRQRHPPRLPRQRFHALHRHYCPLRCPGRLRLQQRQKQGQSRHQNQRQHRRCRRRHQCQHRLEQQQMHRLHH